MTLLILSLLISLICDKWTCVVGNEHLILFRLDSKDNDLGALIDLELKFNMQVLDVVVNVINWSMGIMKRLLDT